jgi:hypothetical protein
VQKTEDLSRLLLLSMTGNGFCIISSLFLLLAVSAGAAGPVLTLAPADQNQAPSNAAMQVDIMAASSSSLFDLKSSPPAGSGQMDIRDVKLPADARLEKTTKSGPGDPLELLPEHRSAASRSNVTFSVQAGYGRIWDEHSMLQKISDGHQETGCAYVSANISF